MTSSSASIPFNSNTEAVCYFINGRQRRVRIGEANYPSILAALCRGASESEILEIEKEGEIPEIFTEKADGLYFEGERLSDALATKVHSLVKQKLPIEFFLNLQKRIAENLRNHVQKQLFSFMEYKELPITPEGFIVAFKGVREDYFSVTGNKQTRVYQGEVRDGHILNSIGATIECDPRDVDDNQKNHCAPGLHAGSLDYAKGWGVRTLVVLIDPKDVICIPDDCACQKMRVCKYKVIAEYGNEIKSAVTDDKANPIENADSAEFSARKARVAAYLEKKKGENVALVTARQIQSSFSPSCPSVAEIRTILGQLGVTVDREGNAILFW